jgi:uncharacterized protein (TIGR02117 family)
MKVPRTVMRNPSWRPMRCKALFLGLFLAACAAVHAQGMTAQPVPIYVVGNGWHAGLVLPAEALNAQVPGLRDRFPQARHYEIGWGDMGFYQAREVTAGLAIEAMLASRGALLHVVGLPGPVEPYLRGADAVPHCVSADAYQRMARLIAQSFVINGAGSAVPTGAGLYGDSQFYMAHGRYSLLFTCNRWTATVLAEGGLPISPRFSLTAGSVLGAVRAKGHACAAGPHLNEQ